MPGSINRDEVKRIKLNCAALLIQQNFTKSEKPLNNQSAKLLMHEIFTFLSEVR